MNVDRPPDFIDRMRGEGIQALGSGSFATVNSSMLKHNF
jgi:hypothetical protein